MRCSDCKHGKLLEVSCLLAAHPDLITLVLQVVQLVLNRHLLDSWGLTHQQGQCGAVMFIQRFDSAANLNVHLHCLVLDEVYKVSDIAKPKFLPAPVPTDEVVQAVLRHIMTRLIKVLRRRGVLVEAHYQTYPPGSEDDSNATGSLSWHLIPYRLPQGAAAECKMAHQVVAQALLAPKPDRSELGRSLRLV
jgi:Putative transposase